MSKSKRFVLLPVFSISLLLLVFLCVEGLFRVLGIPYKVMYIPAENAVARFDSELGWSYSPGRSSIQKTGTEEVEVSFDKYGIRVPNTGYETDPGLPSVLFIGGSFTMGHGLSYEESYVGQFGSFEGQPYQVINAGVQGFGSDQALLSLKRYLRTYNTKVVVYTFIEDHIYRNGNYDRRMLVPTARFLGTKPFFSVSGDGTLHLEKQPLLYKQYLHSYVVDFIKMRIGSLTGSFPPFPEKLTRLIILEMNKICQEQGIHFVVINWRWTQGAYDAIFHNLDIPVIDTFEGAPDGWSDMVLLKGTHPNEESSAHVAHLLHDYFRSTELIIEKPDMD